MAEETHKTQSRTRIQARINLREKAIPKRILEIIQVASLIKFDLRTKEIMVARNILLIKFIYIFAMQYKEITKLKWSSIYTKNNKLYLDIETGRGFSEVDICEINIASLLIEIEHYRKLIQERGIEPDWFFISLSQRTYGRSMSAKGVNDIIVRLSKVRGQSFSAMNIRNLGNAHMFTQGFINDELKPILRDKYFKCRSCQNLIRWRNELLCEDCSKINTTDYKDSGYVYFIQTINQNYTKVGFTYKDVGERLKTNQVGNMYELYLIGYLQSPNFKNIEQDFQSKFRKKHMRGEWFNVSKDEVIGTIKELGYFDIFTEIGKKR